MNSNSTILSAFYPLFSWIYWWLLNSKWYWLLLSCGLLMPVDRELARERMLLSFVMLSMSFHLTATLSAFDIIWACTFCFTHLKNKACHYTIYCLPDRITQSPFCLQTIFGLRLYRLFLRFMHINELLCSLLVDVALSTPEMLYNEYRYGVIELLAWPIVCLAMATNKSAE